jgi:hypothetical protein
VRKATNKGEKRSETKKERKKKKLKPTPHISTPGN